MAKRHLKDTERSRSAEYQYLDLLKDILKNGIKQVDKGVGAVTYSVFGRTLRFDLSEGFPLLTTKKVYWQGVLYELFWFLSGRSNIKYLVDRKVHIWDDYPYRLYNEKVAKGKVPKMSKEEFIEKIAKDNEFAKKYGELPKIYGELWRRWPARGGRTIDQVKWVLEEMIDDPDAHNLIVNSWNPEYLYTMAKPSEASRFPICHNMYQLNVKKGRVHLQLYQRSADVFLGVPFNIASYALLTHIFAHLTGNKPGEFIHTFGDVHVYSTHIEQVEEQIKRKPRPFPKLRIDKAATSLGNIRPEHVILNGYNPHPPIKGELTVIGGYRKRKK